MNRSIKSYLVVYDLCCIGGLLALPALLIFCSFKDQLMYIILIGVGIGGWLTRTFAIDRYWQEYSDYRVAWRFRQAVLVLLAITVVVAIMMQVGRSFS